MATQPAPAAHTAPVTQPDAPKPLDAAGVRAVVAAQPTVAGSVAALVTGVTGSIEKALKDADPGGLQKFAEAMASDVKAWVDAVQANTPDAVLTLAPFVAVPPHLQDVFTQHAQQQAQKAAEGQKAAH